MDRYSSRVNTIAERLSDSVTILATQEAGTVDAVHQMSAALAEATGHQWGDHVWGDGRDISQAVHFDTTVWDDLDTGYVKFEPASLHDTHNIASLVRLGNGDRRVVVCSLQLEYRKGDEYNQTRYDQVDNLVPQVEEWADGDPIIFLGDFNDSIESGNGDGPGEAFAAHGYTDVENTPCPVANPEFNSATHLEVTPIRESRQLDRCFINTNDVQARARRVMPFLDKNGNYTQPWDSDHLTVEFDLTLKEKS